MEEKSIDELRREAQELYQSKLQAYQQSQKQEPKQDVNMPTPVLEAIKIPKSQISKIKLPFNRLDAQIPLKVAEDLVVRPKNNWFIVILFTLLTIILLIKVMVIKP